MQSRRCGVGAGGLAVSVTGFGLGKGGPAHGDRLCVVFSAGTTSRVSARGRLKKSKFRDAARPLTQCHHASAHPGQVPSAFGRGRALPVHQSPTVHNMSSFWHARPDTFHTVTIATNCPARVTKGNFVSQKPLTATHSTQCNKRHDRAHFVVPQKSPWLLDVPAVSVPRESARRACRASLFQPRAVGSPPCSI